MCREKPNFSGSADSNFRFSCLTLTRQRLDDSGWKGMDHVITNNANAAGLL
jgi:hypothetical protein